MKDLVKYIFENLPDFSRKITRPWITKIVILSVIVMIFLKIPIPEWFKDMTLMIVAFWFGSRQDNIQVK
jgi:uncharacterized membrane protein